MFLHGRKGHKLNTAIGQIFRQRDTETDLSDTVARACRTLFIRKVKKHPAWTMRSDYAIKEIARGAVVQTDVNQSPRWFIPPSSFYQIWCLDIVSLHHCQVGSLLCKYSGDNRQNTGADQNGKRRWWNSLEGLSRGQSAAFTGCRVRASRLNFWLKH